MGFVVRDELPPALADASVECSLDRVVAAGSWLSGSGLQFQPGFFDRFATFAVVALPASGNQIVPGVWTIFRPGDDVIDGEILCLDTAVLAGEVIPDEDLPPAKFHPGVGTLDHVHEANHRRSVEHRRGRVDHQVILFEDFGFAVEDEDDRPADIADIERFVVRIEHKNRMMAIESVMAIAVVMIYGSCIVHLIAGLSIGS